MARVNHDTNTGAFSMEITFIGLVTCLPHLYCFVTVLTLWQDWLVISSSYHLSQNNFKFYSHQPTKWRLRTTIELRTI